MPLYTQLYLYRYTCKPNWPVVSKAFVIFQHPEMPGNHGNVLIIGRKLAKQEGCGYAGQDESVELLGTFTATREFRDNSVVHSENGEY